MEEIQSNRRVFLIARVSSRHQAASGLGIAAQITAMRKFADAEGLVEVGVFRDEGVGGAEPLHKRHGLLTALREVKKGDTVLFADRSRIGRHPLVVMSIESEVFKSGGVILTADGLSRSTDAPEQVLIRRLIDSVNEFQRGILKAKTSMALQELKKAGLSTGNPPFGYEVCSLDKKTLKKSKKEQKILKIVFNRRASNASWREVAEELNLSSSTRRGNRWTINSVYGTFNKKVKNNGKANVTEIQ
jgi:DNA invertase Pin-like site-specific DNA recombinase